MLIENEARDAGLKKEHGLSIYIDTGEEKILFDAGASGDFADNAGKLGVDLKDVDMVVVSHAHHDHTGGLLRFLELNGNAQIYINTYAMQSFFYKFLFKKENISAPRELFEKYQERICLLDGDTEINKRITLVSGFKRVYPLVKSSRSLLVERNGKYQEDEFDHEQAMVIDNSGKLVIITGCSHNGVDNMLETIIERFPGMPVQTVIGGFHLMGFPFDNLMGESGKNICELSDRLLSYGIEKTLTCHCTGKRAYNILKGRMGEKIEYFDTGKNIVFS